MGKLLAFSSFSPQRILEHLAGVHRATVPAAQNMPRLVLLNESCTTIALEASSRCEKANLRLARAHFTLDQEKNLSFAL